MTFRRASAFTALLLALVAPALPAQATVEASRRTAIVTAVERLAPAVVSISVEARQQVAMRSSWADMFVPRYASQLVRGSGTGFIIRSNGVILTNQHVVAGAEVITVTLRDGTQLPARLVGADPVADIAVIQVTGRALPTVPLGKSDELMVGEWVVALGNPYADYLGNTEPTVTADDLPGTPAGVVMNQDVDLRAGRATATVIAERPVVALEGIEPAGWFGRAWDTIRLWIK